MWRYEPDEYPRIANRVVDILLNGVPAADAVWQETAGEASWMLDTGGNDTADAFLRAATDLVKRAGLSRALRWIAFRRG